MICFRKIKFSDKHFELKYSVEHLVDVCIRVWSSEEFEA